MVQADESAMIAADKSTVRFDKLEGTPAKRSRAFVRSVLTAQIPEEKL